MSTEEKNEMSPAKIMAIAIPSAIVIVGLIFAIMPEDGKLGGDCYKDGSCYAGLRCKSQKCVKIDDGKEGGECRDNGGCNDELVCNKYGFCEGKKKKEGGVGRNCNWKNGWCRW